jgi:carbamoyl-phosphate synthase large subunit
MTTISNEQREVFMQSTGNYDSTNQNLSPKKMNATVLITAAGGIVGQGIMKSLRLANSQSLSPIKYRILAADSNPLAAGLYRSDVGLIVPKASDPDYVDSVIKQLNENSVDALFVGSDEELVIVARAKKRIENETSSKALVGKLKVIQMAQDKWETYKFLRSHNMGCAESCLPEDRDTFIREFGFPLVVKPREGFSSINFFVANSKDEVEYALSKIQDYGWKPLLQEYLPDLDGEFTSGITMDKNGTSVMSSIAIRKYLKGGLTYKAFIDDFEQVRLSAESIAARLEVGGAVNVQSKYVVDDKTTGSVRNSAAPEPDQVTDYNTGGGMKVFEINPRFSATSPLRSYAGINEPDLVFRNAVCNEKIEKISNHARLVCMRYWNEVFIDHSTYERLKTIGSANYGIENSSIPNYF